MVPIKGKSNKIQFQNISLHNFSARHPFWLPAGRAELLRTEIGLAQNGSDL
jgi:hypothetical protein